MSKKNLTKEIIGRVTLLDVYIKSFIRKTKRYSEDTTALNFIKQKNKELTELTESYISEFDTEKEIKILEKMILTADFLLFEFKNFKCEEKHLNEKSDIIAKTFMIYDKSKQLCDFLKNQK